MNVMWMSNAPWVGTGYGKQTKIILNGLLEKGHTPSLLAFYGLLGGCIEYEGYKVVCPSNYDPWGNDVVKAHSERLGAKAVVTLMDLFILNQEIWSNLELPWIAWTPLDADTIGTPTLNLLKLVDYPVAMSTHGTIQMVEVGVEPAATIYHAVDMDIYKPKDKRECRKELGLDEEAYIIGMVMANKGDRKQYATQLAAIAQWMKTDPDRNIKVYIHTDTTSQMGGWDMKTITTKLGLTGKVYSTSQYDASVIGLSESMMATLYNSFDVLMNCSGGEGFGVPIVEAQACGVPVLATNVTAMTELVHNGYLVEPISRSLANHYGYQYVPSIADMVYRLECIYRRAKHPHDDGGIQWVKENCSIPVIVDQWSQLLKRVEETEAKRTAEAEAISITHPQGTITETIKNARESMDNSNEEYGTYNQRLPEYRLVYAALQDLQLIKGDRILDLGAAFGDLGWYLHEQGWRGVYVPVDMTIDGTNLEDYEIPDGFNFIVAEQVIEHVLEWEKLLDKIEAKNCGVVIVTPNKLEVGEHDKEGLPHQMAHVSLLTPDDLEQRGYKVYTCSLTGRVDDTIVATKLCSVGEENDHIGNNSVEVELSRS